MRILFLLSLILTPALNAAPVGWDWEIGPRFGLGTSSFEQGTARPASSNSTNLFAVLGSSTTQKVQPGLSAFGGLGLELAWRRVIGMVVEIEAARRVASAVKDTGLGISTATEYQRESVDGLVLARLGWPLSVGQSAWARGFLQGGVFGNRTTMAQQVVGLVGETAKAYEWKDLPNEDWGLVWGGGLDWRLPLSINGRSTRPVTIGLDGRVILGQKDLDPKGPFEMRQQTWLAALTISL